METRSRLGSTIRIVAGIALVAGMLLAPATSANAATFTVTKTADTADGTCDADCSLREAITAANAAAGTDTIVLPAGTYVRTIAGTAEDANADGDLDITQSAAIVGAGAGTTIIEGTGALAGERVLDLTEGAIAITGVTIRNGYDAGDGGGIHSDNEVELVLEDSVVSGNKTDSDAGGVYVDGGAHITNVWIDGNSTTGASDDGGGVFVDGAGAPILRNVTISGNTAGGDGGGIGEDNEYYLVNVTVTGNSAVGDGGGLMNDFGASLNNVTIAGNTADSDNAGGGDGGGIQSNDGGVLVRNSIIANNTDLSGGGPDCFVEATAPPIHSLGHNLLRDATGCNGMTGPGDLLGANPLLGPLADNGGFTMTMALLSGSPAINAGDPSKPGSKGTAACAAEDQRGVPRNCDIGAYELAVCAGITVNKVGTPADDTLTGTAGPDGILAGEGNDTVTGLAGDDGICLEEGDDTADGGDGNDQILGGDGNDTLTGGTGNDQIFGEDGNDTGDGGDGNDTFIGGEGNDVGIGGAGKDLLNGENGNDKLNGGGGKDKLLGGGGKDKLNCGGGKKEVGKGGSGKDKSAKCEKGTP